MGSYIRKSFQYELSGYRFVLYDKKDLICWRETSSAKNEVTDQIETSNK